MSERIEYSIAVIGGGVVGCAIVRQLAAIHGIENIILIEKNRFIANEASGGL